MSPFCARRAITETFSVFPVARNPIRQYFQFFADNHEFSRGGMMARPRLPDEVKKARGTFRPSRSLGAAMRERHWPVRNPEYEDVELQDEAVTELRHLWDASLANLVVDGEPNPLIGELEHMERVLIANGVILPTRQGDKSLLRMIAEGCINA